MACTPQKNSIDVYILVNDDVATDLSMALRTITNTVRTWEKYLKATLPTVAVNIDKTHLIATRLRGSARSQARNSYTEASSRPPSPQTTRNRSHTAPAGELALSPELEGLFSEAKTDSTSRDDTAGFEVTIKVVAGSDGIEAANICHALSEAGKELIFISSDFDMPRCTGGEFVNELVSTRDEVPCLIQFRTANTYSIIEESLAHPQAKAGLKAGRILFTNKGDPLTQNLREATQQALNEFEPKLTALIEEHTRSSSPGEVWATLHSAATAPPDASPRVAPSPTEAPTSTSTTATPLSSPTPKHDPSDTIRQAEHQEEKSNHRTLTKPSSTCKQPITPAPFISLQAALSQTASPPDGSRTVRPKGQPIKPRSRLARLCCWCSGKRTRSKEKSSEAVQGK